jgi:nitrogen fixation/metabolism regulation signal transduction histidine kinase
LVIIAGGLFYILANKELSAEYYKAHSTLKYVMQNLLPWLLLVNLLGILVTLFFAMFYTHKIAGPTYRMQEDLRRIAQGILTTQVKTRKRDQLKELESEINKMTEELRLNIQKIKENFFKLENNLTDLEKIAKTRDLSDSQLHQLLEKIRICQERISRRLSFFKTN